eukprot:5571591-Pleurochrysis_carterae.AAC.1
MHRSRLHARAKATTTTTWCQRAPCRLRRRRRRRRRVRARSRRPRSRAGQRSAPRADGSTRAATAAPEANATAAARLLTAARDSVR